MVMDTNYYLNQSEFTGVIGLSDKVKSRESQLKGLVRVTVSPRLVGNVKTMVGYDLSDIIDENEGFDEDSVVNTKYEM